MMGITNAPQGASGGGGGEWTLRTANNDWTDMFDNTSSANQVTVKKDVLMIASATNTNDNSTVFAYLPKGLTWSGNLKIPANGGGTASNTIRTTLNFQLSKAKIASSSTSLVKNALTTTVSIDFDAKTFSLTTVNDGTGIIQKSSFTIYTRD